MVRISVYDLPEASKDERGGHERGRHDGGVDVHRHVEQGAQPQACKRDLNHLRARLVICGSYPTRNFFNKMEGTKEGWAHVGGNFSDHPFPIWAVTEMKLGRRGSHPLLPGHFPRDASLSNGLLVPLAKVVSKSNIGWVKVNTLVYLCAFNFGLGRGLPGS